MGCTRSDFLEFFNEDNIRCNLITSKHDPDNVGTIGHLKAIKRQEGSVVSHQIKSMNSGILPSYLACVDVYVDSVQTSKWQKPHFYTTISCNPQLTVASGTTYSFSIVDYCGEEIDNKQLKFGVDYNLTKLDKLVLVKGYDIGWHLFGASNEEVNRKLVRQKIELLRRIIF